MLRLKIPENSIDIVVAEVKNCKVEFNDTLKKEENRATQNWFQIFRWVGLFNENEIKILVPTIIDIVNLNGKMDNGRFQFIEHSNKYGKITVRPILFVIDKEYNVDSEKIWIDGKELIDYLWKCFCPEIKRECCSTRYPENLWGTEYKDIVSYFKDRHEKDIGKGTLQRMYDCLINQ